jgi:hypothetical protein
MVIRTPYVVVYMCFNSGLCHTIGPMIRREAVSKATRMSREDELVGMNPAQYWRRYRFAKAMPQASAQAFCKRFEAFDSLIGGSGGWT